MPDDTGHASARCHPCENGGGGGVYWSPVIPVVIPTKVGIYGFVTHTRQ
ncbi:MAG: hypothetical protein QGH99_02650 [Pseudomonadales bacterium]|nr:hypothetical protein [Pseudomonadales bacterium]MDP6317086.1 hypothetical protein [Pseudomonadales bacterium]MDP7316160.1 hypothetical protein [Pseudomonadales bacterium]MDP7575837.1 hypothetical protein [Pseudomonadales bacterium]HJP50783.1 hypothetical protein [Pseudomonadales bacterium]